MSRFEFRLATYEDDAALRQLLAATPMHGEIELAFAREPSYFSASAVDGQFVQVVAAFDKQSQRLVGMGSRAIDRSYVNGQAIDVGYLSALRLLPEYRGKAALLARGYHFFRELHYDRRAPFYLTTVAADNTPAIELLTSQRAGLPIYHPLGRFFTLTLSPATRVKAPSRSGMTIRKSTYEDGEQIRNFLDEQGPKRQFFPVYDACEFFESPRRLSGLHSESVLLAHLNGRLVGTLGIWNQRGFKQSIVCGYSKRLTLGRPLYNAIAAVRSKPKLPQVGEPLNLRYAAIPVVAGNDPDIARALIHAAVTELREQEGGFLILGLHQDDPLLPLIRPYSGRKYATLIYLVSWPDESLDIEELTHRVPYLELGCL